MASQQIAWKRFWKPRGRVLEVDTHGLLPDPETEDGKEKNGDLVFLDDLRDRPFVILLGEPGLGKTTAVRDHVRFLRQLQLGNHRINVKYVRLTEFSSFSELRKRIFPKEFAKRLARQPRRINKSGKLLHLVMDDVDECMLQMSDFPNLLIGLLEECNKDSLKRSLRLRLVCRTAVWPEELEMRLRSLFKIDGDSPITFDLTPLRLGDIVVAAQDRCVDPHAFLEAVHRSGALAFVNSPIGLIELLALYSEQQPLPSRQIDLYEALTRRLAAYGEYYDNSKKRRRELTTDQMLTILGRIAATMLLSGHNTARSSSTSTDGENGIVSGPDLVGLPDETVAGAVLTIDESVTMTALNSPFFRGHLKGTLQWTQRTHAEFLAARYLTQRQLATSKLKSLLVHPGDPEHKLIPMLREVGAWLASYSEDVFREVTTIDPLALLRSDIAMHDDTGRYNLVAALLRAYDVGTIAAFDWARRLEFQKLLHPLLSDQLRVFMRDPGGSETARRVAIAIAEVCRLSDLEDILVASALDQDEFEQVRIDAAHAIVRVGDENAKGKLKPLVFEEFSPHMALAQEELRGCGLMATWPGHLSAREMFSVLSSRSGSIFGAYSAFLAGHDLYRHLTASDLPVALAWVAKQPKGPYVAIELRELIQGILARAIEEVDNEEVAEAFTQVVLASAEAYVPLLDRPSLPEVSRRDAIQALIGHIRNEAELRAVMIQLEDLVRSSDLNWLVDELDHANSLLAQRSWASLIRLAYDEHEPNHTSTILGMRERSSILREETPFLDPILIDSDQARFLRDQHRRLKTRAEQSKESTDDSSTFEDITHLLDRFANGEDDAFWQLNLRLTVKAGSDRYGNEFEPDLTVLPGWRTINNQLRDRVVRAAKDYLERRTPEPQIWINKKGFLHRPDWAGYRALQLLLKVAPNEVERLPIAIWRKWAAVIVGYKILSGRSADAPQQSLVRRAYAVDAPAVISTIRALLMADPDDVYSIVRKIDLCWDDDLARLLAELLQDLPLPFEGLLLVLGKLLTHQLLAPDSATEGLRLGISLLNQSNAATGEETERTIAAACALLLNVPAAGWDAIWSLIEREPSLGEEIMQAVALRDDQAWAVTQGLDEEQIANLFVWLEYHFPHRDDADLVEPRSVGPRDKLSFFRDFLITRLEERGSDAAYASIQQIQKKFPSLSFAWPLARTAETIRNRGWHPLSARALLQFFANNDTRLVQTPEQLLEVVMESLQRLECKLQFEESQSVLDLWDVVTDAARRQQGNELIAALKKHGIDKATLDGFWDVHRKTYRTSYRPKEEILLSHYVKRHLDTDLKGRRIIFNREVENRVGDIADIRVDAIVRREDGQIPVQDIITIIIEAKGNWNRGLEKDLERQLAARYLQSAESRHGIYLVGWYSCERWDSSDSRKKAVPKYNIDLARHRFSEQAAEASSHHSVVVKSIVLDVGLGLTEDNARLGNSSPAKE